MTARGRKSSLYSPVAWSASSYALVWRMLELIEQNDFYLRGLWPAPGDPTVAATKVQLYQSIARDLLEATPPYVEHLQTGNKEGEKYYGLSIKAELLKLEKQYHAAKEELGVTGGSCYYEEEIWDKGPIRDKWEELKKTCPYHFFLGRLMDRRTNIATHAITNSAIGLDRRHLLGDDSPLNSEDEREDGGTNEGNNDVLSEEELITMGTNSQPETSDPPILIDPNLDSTLPSPYITATHPTPRRPEPKKAKSNANKKSNTGSHVSAINDLDLSSHNSANGSFTRKRGTKDVFTSLELVSEASEKRKRLRDEGIEGTKVQILQEKEETRRIKASYAKDIKLRRLEKKEKDAERKHELALKKMEFKLQLLEKKHKHSKVTNTHPVPSLQPESKDASRSCLSSPHKTPDNDNFAEL